MNSSCNSYLFQIKLDKITPRQIEFWKSKEYLVSGYDDRKIIVHKLKFKNKSDKSSNSDIGQVSQVNKLDQENYHQILKIELQTACDYSYISDNFKFSSSYNYLIGSGLNTLTIYKSIFTNKKEFGDIVMNIEANNKINTFCLDKNEKYMFIGIESQVTNNNYSNLLYIYDISMENKKKVKLLEKKLNNRILKLYLKQNSNASTNSDELYVVCSEGNLYIYNFNIICSKNNNSSQEISLVQYFSLKHNIVTSVCFINDFFVVNDDKTDLKFYDSFTKKLIDNPNKPKLKGRVYYFSDMFILNTFILNAKNDRLELYG